MAAHTTVLHTQTGICVSVAAMTHTSEDVHETNTAQNTPDTAHTGSDPQAESDTAVTAVVTPAVDTIPDTQATVVVGGGTGERIGGGVTDIDDDLHMVLVTVR